MEKTHKLIAKNTLVLYGRMLFSMLVSLYTSRVILNTLGFVDYGIWNVVGGVVTMFAFLNSSMSGATSRFLTVELGKKNDKGYQRYFSVTLVNHLVLVLLVVLLAETVGLWFVEKKLVIPPDRRDAAFLVFHIAVASAAFSIAQIPYTASLIAHEKMTVYAYVGMADVLLKLGSVLLLKWAPMDKLVFWASAQFLVAVSLQVFYVLYVKKTFAYCRFKFQRSKKLYQQTLSYSGWDMIGCLSLVAQGQGLNMLLNIFFGPTVNAARGIAYQVQGSLTQFVNNFMIAARPQIIKDFAAGEKARMVSLVLLSARFSFFLLLVMALPLLLEMDYVLSVWLKQVPPYTTSFARIVLLLAMIQAWRNPFIAAMHATGKIQMPNVICGILLISTLPIAYWLLKCGGSPTSVFVVLLAITSLSMVIEWLLIRHNVGFSFTQAVGQVVLRCVLVAGVSACLPVLLLYLLPMGLMRFLIVASSACGATLGSIFFLGLKKQESLMLVKKLGDMRKKYAYSR